MNFDNKIIFEDMKSIYDITKGSRFLKNSRIYISGATGMIASYLVMYIIWLNEYKDYKITLYAGIRNESKAYSKFGLYCDKSYFHFVKGDISKSFDLDFDIDYIVHAASLASPQYYGCMPVETMLPNISGTLNLLEYAKNHCVKSMLFFSSGAVYGELNQEKPISENQCGDLNYLTLSNLYGESKRAGEALCFAFANEYKIPVNSIRINHTYGPTLDLKSDTRVFSEFVSNIVDNNNIVMKSDGTQKRSFSYIVDCITALLFIISSRGIGESFNFSNDSDSYISISELAELLVNLFPEKKLKVERSKRELEGYVQRQDKILEVSTRKLKELGWKPNYNLQEGFRRTISAIEYDINKIGE